MWCSSCQTEGDVLGFCDCANPVYVTAGERAAAAIAANPEKSDRAIAAEIGVDKSTVTRARKVTGANEPVEPSRRVGLDGKSRKPPSANAERRAVAEARSAKAAALAESGWDAGQIAAELGVTHRYVGVILEKLAIARQAPDEPTLRLTDPRATVQLPASMTQRHHAALDMAGDSGAIGWPSHPRFNADRYDYDMIFRFNVLEQQVPGLNARILRGKVGVSCAFSAAYPDNEHYPRCKYTHYLPSNFCTFLVVVSSAHATRFGSCANHLWKARKKALHCPVPFGKLHRSNRLYRNSSR